MRNSFDFDLDTVDPDGIAESQTTIGAADLDIDGAKASGGVATLDMGRLVSLTVVTANYGAINFTITGTDPDGRAQTEVMLGPNDNTVESTKYFKTVTSIATAGALATAIVAGFADSGCSPTYPVDSWSSEPAMVALKVTGTISVTVQDTPSDVNDENRLPHQNAVWQDVAALATKTADVHARITDGIRAFRVLINSHSAGAEVLVSVSQVSGK